MLNKFIFIICCGALFAQACNLFSENLDSKPSFKWQINYDEALKQAKTTSKPLALFFTGSDWCSGCTKLEEETFNTTEFAALVGNKFIFVKLDSPLYTIQDPETKSQNKNLQLKFGVRSFPTLILYDAQNDQTIGCTGYRPGGGKQYGDYILKLFNDYSSYKQKMSNLDKGNYSGKDLKQLYKQAHKFSLSNDADEILKKGITTDKSNYFLTERYRLYAHQGQINHPDAITLKQQLLAADPNNEKKIPYQIALIEFEAYSEKIEDDSYSPELAVAPLNIYIQRYGKQDKVNSWRLQMIISQVYLNHDQMSDALKHAEYAYETAPPSAQPEIAKAIQTISNEISSSSFISFIQSDSKR